MPERGTVAVVPAEGDQVKDLIQVSADPSPWAARKQGGDRLFRARLRPGTALLPAREVAADRRGVTVGVASRPIVLRGLGVAHPVPAHVPWIVPADVPWRISLSEAADLRLVHSVEIPAAVVDSVVVPNRPTRFAGELAAVVRTALTSATPVWIDQHDRPVKDLAGTPRPDWRLVGRRSPAVGRDPDHDNAFVLMVTWALEQLAADDDPQIAVVTRYVRTHLADPGLNTARVAEQLRISRRTLQTLFEAHGGVAAYIRRIRLAAVVRLIATSPDGMPDLDAAAAATGLGSRRTLERAMRQVYDLSPRQVQAHVLTGRALPERDLSDLKAS